MTSFGVPHCVLRGHFSCAPVGAQKNVSYIGDVVGNCALKKEILMIDETKLLVNGDFLILKKSVFSHIFKLIFFFFFFLIWYSTVLQNFRAESSINYMSIIFFLAPLFSIFEIIRSIKIIYGADVFYFNKIRKEIFQDKIKLGNFSDVDFIQIRTISNSESANDYRLSIVFKNEKKVFLDQLQDYDKICEIADGLSDVIDTSIKRKG